MEFSAKEEDTLPFWQNVSSISHLPPPPPLPPLSPLMEFPLSSPPCTVTQPPTPPPTSPLMQSPPTPPPAPLKEPTPTPFMQPRSPFLPSPLTQPRAPPSPTKRPPLTSPTCTSPSSPSPLRPISKATWDRDNYGHCWESFITTTTITTSTTPALTLHTTLLHTPSPILPPLFPTSPPAPFPILPAGTFPIPPPPPFAIIPSPTPFSPDHFPTSSTPFATIPSTIMNIGGDMLGWSGTPGIPLGQPRSSSFSRGRLRGRGGRGRRRGGGGGGGGGGGEEEEGELECVFCKKNGEMKEFYSTHVLKDPFGMVICPVLRAYVCPKCGASGYHAHTLSHCPLAGNPPPLPPVVRRRRTSCGKKIFLPDHKFY